MQSFLQRVDRLLRTRPEEGFRASQAAGEGPDRAGLAGRRHLLVAIIVLGALYGAAMGLYALIGREGSADGWKQLVATSVKVPVLFLATLAITYPSLYVVSALAGSRLPSSATTALLLASTTITVALLASLAPITMFFTLSTESYAFIVLLNVGFFATAGFVGLAYLRRALDSAFPDLDASSEPEAPPLPEPLPPPEGSTLPAIGIERVHPTRPLSRTTHRVKPPARRVFEAWTCLFGVVGAQMGWVLRPFVGDPALPFTLFREREGNFLLAVLVSIRNLLTGS